MRAGFRTAQSSYGTDLSTAAASPESNVYTVEVWTVYHASKSLASEARSEHTSLPVEAVLKERLILFGAAPKGRPIKRGWLHMLILLWKFVIIDLTAVALEDATLRAHSVWRSALEQTTPQNTCKKRGPERPGAPRAQPR